MRDSSKSREKFTISIIITIGAAWGFLEATLGYLLHLASRIVFIPSLAGFVMFPLGLFLMITAFRMTGNHYAPLFVALVAASVKLSSLLLPGVGWFFVSNPVISIMAEGLVVFTGIHLFTIHKNWAIFPKAFVLGLVWRSLFLLAVFLLPVQKGIFMKGTAGLLSFIFLDSIVNAGIIGGVVLAGIKLPSRDSIQHLLSHPVPAGTAFVLAVAAQIGFSLI